MKAWIFAAVLLATAAGMANGSEANLSEIVFYVH